MTAPAQAGWARTDITPPLGLPLGGRGPKFTPARSVLDPLSAHAVLLQDGRGTRTLWVSLDLIGMGEQPAGAIRQELAAVAAVPPGRVLLNFAHTHSGPMVNFDRYIRVGPRPPGLADYERELRDRLQRLADQAVRRMRPVTIAWHEGRSRIAINRRLPIASGPVEMRPNPHGTHNPELWVLDIRSATRSASGGLRASDSASADSDRCVLFCHACHPVIVYGFAYEAISADFPGRARRRLAERLGPNVHCQFFQSFAGNVRPRVLADLETPAFRTSTADDLPAAGDTLADDVAAALDAPGEPLRPDLAAADDFFLAARGEPPPAAHWEKLANDPEPLNRDLADYWLKRYAHGPPLAQVTPWPIGLIALDPGHWIAWMAGEVFGEWLGLLRGWLGRRRLMAWGYTNQVPAYLPTDAVLDEGGYEIDRAPGFGPNGPARFARGLDAAGEASFTELARRLESSGQR